MDLTPYVSALREDLLTAASAGDEQTRRTAGLLAAAIEPAARLALLNALADMAAEVTESLGGERVVEVRLDGREARIAVGEPARPEPAPEPAPPSGDAGDMSRITLRLVEQLKGHAEQAASSQGMSLNSWIAQAVQGALRGQLPGGDRGQGRDRMRGPGEQERRLRGWVQG
ncbi:MAG: toxin-antitoxin system HicB family antitoxin [Pseudonocardia sp.]|jgi:hypothetical protein